MSLITRQAGVWKEAEPHVTEDSFSVSNRQNYPEDLIGVTYGNGVFVHYGDYSQLYYSLDGIIWESGPSIAGPTAIRFVRYINDIWVGSFSSYGPLFTSSDGTTWSSSTIGEVGYTTFDMAWGAGVYVAATSSGLYYATSLDASSWTQGVSGNFKRVIFADNQFVAIDSNNDIWVSPNGISWTLKYSESYVTYNDIFWDGAHYCLVGRYTAAGQAWVWFSSDLVNWADSGNFLHASALYGVTKINDQWVVIGDTNPAAAIHFSSDRVNWTPISLQGSVLGRAIASNPITNDIVVTGRGEGSGNPIRSTYLLKPSVLWKPVDTGFVKDAGVWKEFYSSGPPAIGEPWEGGYFAGKIMVGGVTYAIVVAPKSLGGEAPGTLAWKTSRTTTSGTSSVNDGWANTNAMNNSSHPAARFCRNLTIGGYNDWYLPAKDELEVLYRYLKPATQANNTSNGANTNSVPPTGNYTSNNPAQTSITLFREGNAEAFIASTYWSSTEYSSGNAWRQIFNIGIQGNNIKTYMAAVRAIRRVAI